MEKQDIRYRTYVRILKEELVPAMGCTEPIAISYCAAIARKTLGCLPERTLVEASGNIIKNVKSVVVPNTGGLRGIEAAAAAGKPATGKAAAASPRTAAAPAKTAAARSSAGSAASAHRSFPPYISVKETAVATLPTF